MASDMGDTSLTETRTLRIGASTLPYTVRRSPRRRTVGLEVSVENGVVVSTPLQYESAWLERFLAERADWIEHHNTRFEARRQLAGPPKQYTEGEPWLLLGQQYTLRLAAPRRGEKVWLEGDQLWVAAQQPAAVRRALLRFVRRQARAVLEERVAHFCAAWGRPRPRVLIHNAKRRWANCNAKGELRFSARLVLAPVELIDYVVVHELCHLEELNHSPRFWSLVASRMPDYEARHQELQHNGLRFRL